MAVNKTSGSTNTRTSTRHSNNGSGLSSQHENNGKGLSTEHNNNGNGIKGGDQRNGQQGQGGNGQGGGANSGPPGPGGVYQSPTLGVHLNKLASIFEKTPAYADVQWLTSTLGKNFDKAKTWFDAQITYLKGINPATVKGGFMALVDMIKGGKWGEIGTAIQEAPVVAQASGALAIGGILFLSVTGITTGMATTNAVLGKVAGTTVGKWVLGALGLGGASIASNWQSIFSTGEAMMNFNWQASDASLFRGIKDAIERLYEPMGGALGKACASVIVGRSTGTMKININVRTLAMATLIGTPDQSPAEDAMAEALAEMCSSLSRVGNIIMGTLAFMGGRKIANYITGNDWGADENASFIPAKKLGEIKEQILKPIEVNEKLTEAFEEFTEEFYDTLKELLTDEDTHVNFVRA